MITAPGTKAVLAELIGIKTAMISDHLQPWVRREGNASFVWTVIRAIAATMDEALNNAWEWWPVGPDQQRLADLAAAELLAHCSLDA